EAGKAANHLGVPVLVDPVGAGATSYRTRTVTRLLDELDVAILKGNAGEIATMAGSEAKVVGVDSHGVSGDPLGICRDYAASLGVTVVMTGPQDIISDGSSVFMVDNGHPLMESVSGTGCMASTVVAAFSTVSGDRALSSASALASFGVAAERAAERCQGPMSFKAALFDSLAALKPEDLVQRAKIRRVE
ncbi:MAG: hydroxyethylthiazole kinase, partial [Candidatus Methanomethylophilaceae archaeon]